MGAGMAVSEMMSSNAQLWNTSKSRRRADHQGEVDPIAVQIAGADPAGELRDLVTAEPGVGYRVRAAETPPG